MTISTSTELRPDMTKQNSLTVPFRRVMLKPSYATLPWTLIATGFDLGNYLSSFSFHIELTDIEREKLQQYIDRCSALAQCDPIWQDYSSTWISNAQRPVGTDYNTISDHDMRIVCLTFRQLYANNEPGMTFKRTYDLIQRISREQLGPTFESLQDTFLQPLFSAFNELKVKDLDYIFYDRVHPDRPAIMLERDSSQWTPEVLISVMFYGGYIHAGDKKNEFNAIKENPAKFHHHRLEFLRQVSALSLVFLSFGELILTMARNNGLVRPLSRTEHETSFSFDS